jgi:hypothetical protein
MERSIEQHLSFLNSLNNPSQTQTAKACCQSNSRKWGGIRGVVITVLSLVLVSTSISPGTLLAATITATTCSYADVKASLDRAANGDTVLVPKGTCTWTSSMDFDNVIANGRNKYLTLQGAGIDQTIIIDGVSKATFPNVPHLLRWTTVNGGLTRITEFTFQGGVDADCCNQGMLNFRGNSHLFRFDHNKVVPTRTSGTFLYDDIWGVLDHNTFDVSRAAGVYTFHNSWAGVGAYGDQSWASPGTLGTQQAIFFEDNTFTNDKSVRYQNYAVDGWMGGRVVYRNNIFNACTWANHGTESGGRQRSQRQYEVYNNTFTWNLSGNSFPSLVGSRGGVGVVYDNTALISNGTVNEFFDFTYYRANQSFAPWGKCMSVWDQSSASCLDQTGKGQGALISGDNPTPAQWPNQITDPTYAWNNTINGITSNAVSHVPNVVVLNRDFFNQPRPGYAPYTYPHPLTTGSGSTNSPPSPPQNVKVL